MGDLSTLVARVRARIATATSERRARPSYEDLEDMARELEDAAADHTEDMLDLQRRLDEARHERDVLRDQLTTVHTRPRPPATPPSWTGAASTDPPTRPPISSRRGHPRRVP